MRKMSIIAFVLGITLTRIMAESDSPVATVHTITVDECTFGGTGTPTTQISLDGDSNAYYFLNTSASAANWLSILETAQSTGQKVKFKYDSATNPSYCHYNNAHLIHYIALNL